MKPNLVTHIQTKINSLKDELKAIRYTREVDAVRTDSDEQRSNECICKIQVLNEILISFGAQKN
jgi:hypothetical protein